LDLTLQCHCRVSRVRAVRHWRGVPPACRVRRVSPENGVTGAKRAPRETRVHQVDYHETHSIAAGKLAEDKHRKNDPPPLFLVGDPPTKIRVSFVPSAAPLRPCVPVRKIQKLRGFVLSFPERWLTIAT